MISSESWDSFFKDEKSSSFSERTMSCCIYFKEEKRQVSLGGGINIGAGASVIVLFLVKQWFLQRFCNKDLILLTIKRSFHCVNLPALHGNLYWVFPQCKKRKHSDLLLCYT